MHIASLVAVQDRLAVALFDRLRDPLLFVLRVTWGWLFFRTGFGKLTHLDGTTQFFAGLGLPLPFANAVMVGMLEGVGGLLLLAGFGGRAVAMLLAGNMAVAYLTAHRDAFASLDAFTAAAPFLYLLTALVVLAFGPGAWSLDSWLRPRAVARPAVAAPSV
jgi:putative oxidoreductase